MTLAEFKRIVFRNKWKVIIIPVVTAASIYVLGKRLIDKKYTSDTTLFSGQTSSYKIAGDNNAIDNQLFGVNALGDFVSLLNSRGIKEEVAIRMLARDLRLSDPDPKVLNKENFAFLEKRIPFNKRQDLVGTTLEETIAKVRSVYNADQQSTVYQIINSPKSHAVYSLNELGKVQAGQIGISELVKVEYTTSDPAVSYGTLVLMDKVFVERFDALFAKQAKSVVGFFDSTANVSSQKLKTAEQKLLDYQKANNIADYDQQINATTGDVSASVTRLNDLQSQYTGAQAALRASERQLKNKGVSNLQNEDILQAKDDVSNLTKQLTDLELLGTPSADNTAKMVNLRQQIASATATMKDATNKLYNSEHSIQGVPIAPLLDDYVKNTQLVAQLRSQLGILRNQNAATKQGYTKLVPVGVQLASLRRDVDLASKDYIAQTEGLRASKLTEQNSELSASHLKILDPPNFPVDANSTLPVLVIVGFMAAFIVVVGWLVAADMLDTSLKSPPIAEKVTGFKVLGILPVLDSKKESHALEDKITEDEMARQLLLRFYKKDSAKLPFVVGVLSSYSGEGKSLIATSLANNLNQLGVKTMAMLPKEKSQQDTAVVAKVVDNGVHLGGDEVVYNPPMGISKNSVAEVTGTKFYDYSVILVEFPAVLEKAYPVSLLQHLDYILLTVKANRSWHKPDVSIYKNIANVTDAPIELILNGVKRHYLEDFLGSPSLG